MSVRTSLIVASLGLALPLLAGCGLAGGGGTMDEGLTATSGRSLGGGGGTATGGGGTGGSGTPSGTGNPQFERIATMIFPYANTTTSNPDGRGLGNVVTTLVDDGNASQLSAFTLGSPGFLQSQRLSPTNTRYFNGNAEVETSTNAFRDLSGNQQTLQNGLYGLYDITLNGQRETGVFGTYEDIRSNADVEAAFGPQVTYTGGFMGQMLALDRDYAPIRLDGRSRIDMDFNTSRVETRISDIQRQNGAEAGFDIYADNFLFGGTSGGYLGSATIVRPGATVEDTSFSETTDSLISAEVVGPSGEEIFGTVRATATSSQIISGSNRIDVYGGFGARVNR